MAYPNSNPFSASAAGGSPSKGGPQRLALDNLLRRELKVGDPSDPAQIAQALLSKYQNDPRANAIAQEARGLPFLNSAAGSPQLMPAATSTNTELQQARNDVERDLQELLTDALLKDLTPEIQGWAQAIRAAIQEGPGAASMALDPNQRDKAFGIRRQLGDYARMARLIGAMTPAMNANYRKLALSLDEVAAVMLVLMGDALSNLGFNGGRFLLQAPYSELQVRRDAAIYALRNLVGSTQQAYGPNEWQRGLDAYRTLFRVLEEQGQGDLRALLSEQELARVMDELIERSAHGNVEGLRALGATAMVDLERFRRLVYIGQSAVNPASPPFSAFLETLQLFADAFGQSGGYRLMRISRPPILFYGLYGNMANDASGADARLLKLIVARGQLADYVDSLLMTSYGDTAVKLQVLLDKVLYDVDRAIDLFAVGKDTLGKPERRAAAYAYVIDQVILKIQNLNLSQYSPILDLLNEINIEIRPILDAQNGDEQVVKSDLISYVNNILTIIPEGEIKTNIKSLMVVIDPNQLSVITIKSLEAKISAAYPVEDTKLNSDIIGFIIKQLEENNPNNAKKLNFKNFVDLYKNIKEAQFLIQNKPNAPHFPQSLDRYFGILSQELNVQRDMEKRWGDLMRTMAPDTIGISAVLDSIKMVIDAAVQSVGNKQSADFKTRIPPNYEVSLNALANDML